MARTKNTTKRRWCERGSALAGLAGPSAARLKKIPQSSAIKPALSGHSFPQWAIRALVSALDVLVVMSGASTIMVFRLGVSLTVRLLSLPRPPFSRFLLPLLQTFRTLAPSASLGSPFRRTPYVRPRDLRSGTFVSVTIWTAVAVLEAALIPRLVHD